MQRHHDRRGKVARLGQRGTRIVLARGRHLRREAFAASQHQSDRRFERIRGTVLGQQAAHALRQAARGQWRGHLIGQHKHALRLQAAADIGKRRPAALGIGGQAENQQIGMMRPWIGLVRTGCVKFDKIAGDVRLRQQMAQPKTQ